MAPPTSPKSVIRVCAPYIAFSLLTLLTKGADTEANLPPGMSPPPAPYTKAVDRSEWVLDVLTELYPWREWSKLERGGDPLSFGVSYALKEPEFVEIKENKTPDGRELGPFRSMPVAFARQCRPTGDRGRLKASSVTWLIYPGSTEKGLEPNRGNFSLSDLQDTPDDPKTIAGTSLRKISEKKRVVDIAGPIFTENYPRWIQQHQQYVALLNSPKLTKWSGVINFPQGKVTLVFHLQNGGFELFDEQGKRVWSRISAHPNFLYEFEIAGDEYGLVRIVGNTTLGATDKGALTLQEHIQRHVNPFTDPDDRTIAQLMFIDFRIKIIDANTMRVSSLGIPETLFRQLP